MSLEKELLLHLNNENETFTTKAQYATNLFNSSELPAESKITILKWIINIKTNEQETVWTKLQNLFSSNQLKNVTRNEMDNKEIKAIIEGLIINIQEISDDNIVQIIYKTVILLVENKLFQQYFKVDVELYLKLINCVLLKIHEPNNFKDFLNTHVFNKSLITTEGFMKQFVHLFKSLVKCAAKFDDKSVFLQTSKLVQRCMFHDGYKNVINQFFDSSADNTETCGLQILLKHLLNIFESNKKSPELHFKLAFHAFAVSHENDPIIIYKYFMILIDILGFRYDVVSLSNPLMYETQQTKKSNKILLELILVLEEIKVDLNCKVNEINFTELLKAILTESIFPNKPSKLNYQIVNKIILLDPTISQTLTEQILSYSLSTNNMNESEELMLTIFDLFSKLHRIENLISKLVAALNNCFNAKTFDGENLITENMLTNNILQSFSQKIQSLASWQIINVFKTFLFALKQLLENKNGIENGAVSYCLHMEFLNKLIDVFLSSIRVAEHTVAENVVKKTEKCLTELEDSLCMFGKELLNSKHNCSLMRSFLNIAYNWAEISLVLRYYSMSFQKVTHKRPSGHNFAACNVTYLHPYLSTEEWCLISERITNFGESSCKKLLYKLFIQEVRALYMFESKVNNEILTDLSRYVTSDLEQNWREIVQNKFLMYNLVPILDPSSKNFLAEKIIDNFKNVHISNNNYILRGIVYSIIIKCNRIISKRKRKLDEDSVGIHKTFSMKICTAMSLDQFYNKDENKECINKMKEICKSINKTTDLELKFNENKVLDMLEVLRKFPVIFCEEYVQQFFILYFFALHNDLTCDFANGNYKKLQKSIENLIIGILQQYKYKLTDIFNIKSLCLKIVSNFEEWKEIFILIIENIFKNKDSFIDYESLIMLIVEKLHNPIYMQCGIIIINTVNKLKKVKMSKEIKSIAENYRTMICNKICDLVLHNDPNDDLILGYAYALKTSFGQNEETQTNKLLSVLDSYTNYTLGRKDEFDKIGYLLLFNTILQNKPKIERFDEKLPLNVWLACKDKTRVFSKFEEYSQLILLLICSISNEEFSFIINDLILFSEDILNQNKYEEFGHILKTWESIFTSNLNPVKTKSLQMEIEKLLSQILTHLENSNYNGNFYRNVIEFEMTLVQTNHFHLTSPMIDVLILNTTIFVEREDSHFQLFFTKAVTLLYNLIKYRKPLIMDRLPPYLQQYRLLLKIVCKKSDSDNCKDENVREIVDCAYQLEKLTKSMVVHQKDMCRIAMYLIADILDQYEKVTIYPNVKMHLNNCIYSLITLCDQHAISYLMRVLSSASTEIFKVMYENYKKYYRFTGKA